MDFEIFYKFVDEIGLEEFASCWAFSFSFLALFSKSFFLRIRSSLIFFARSFYCLFLVSSEPDDLEDPED